MSNIFKCDKCGYREEIPSWGQYKISHSCQTTVPASNQLTEKLDALAKRCDAMEEDRIRLERYWQKRLHFACERIDALERAGKDRPVTTPNPWHHHECGWCGKALDGDPRVTSKTHFLECASHPLTAALAELREAKEKLRVADAALDRLASLVHADEFSEGSWYVRGDCRTPAGWAVDPLRATGRLK